jgi:uncharacterized membrane protein
VDREARPPTGSPARLPLGTKVVVGAFTISGVTHLVRPKVFRSLIPRWLGNPQPWVLGSGVAELVCAGGLVTKRRWAPPATALALSIIWIGNIQMAISMQSDPDSEPAAKAAGWLRLPLQVPLIYWAWKSPTRERG